MPDFRPSGLAVAWCHTSRARRRPIPVGNWVSHAPNVRATSDLLMILDPAPGQDGPD